MALDLPVHDLVIIRDQEFLCSNLFLKMKIKELLRQQPGLQFVGTELFSGFEKSKRSLETNKPIIPHIIFSYNKPILFKEGGLYLKDNPVPQIVVPHRLEVPTKDNTLQEVYIYSISFL